MSLTEKNVSGVPLIAFTAVSYVCASCLSLGACSALPMWRGDNSLLSVAWNNGAGKPGWGMQNRDLEGKAEKVGPGQR